MDARLRARITRGLKKGDKVTVDHGAYYELLEDEKSGQSYVPFYAIRVGPWWYVFRVPQSRPWKTGGWKSKLVMTFLERRRAAVHICNRLAQLSAQLTVQRYPQKRGVARCRHPTCTDENLTHKG